MTIKPPLSNTFPLAATTDSFSASLFAHALASTSCGITVADARRPQMPLVYCNPAFTRITGYTPEETLGYNCRFLQGSETDPGTVTAIRTAIKKGQDLKVVLKNYRKDKTPFWNEFILSPVYSAQGELTYFIGVQNDITSQKQAEDALRELNRELDERVHTRTQALMKALQAEAESREQALLIVGLALEYRDYETKGHTERVTHDAVRVGQVLGLEKQRLNDLRWGGYLHDAGKIAISDDILLKPEKLTTDEFALMKRHVLIGEEMLGNLSFLPQTVLEVVRHHHERWDGSGYPDGLSHADIPLLARIFSVVDVYDALTSERPYKVAWSHEQAIIEIVQQSGKQFDPRVVEAFLSQDWKRTVE